MRHVVASTRHIQPHPTKERPVFWAIASIVSTVPTASGVRLVKQDQAFVFRHPAFIVQVDPQAGGWIRSWVLTPSGRDLAALWRGANEIGGLLDDRSFFSARSHQATIMNPGPQTASLRLTSPHPSRAQVARTLSVSADNAALLVRYEFRNGTQAPPRRTAAPRGPSAARPGGLQASDQRIRSSVPKSCSAQPPGLPVSYGGQCRLTPDP